jgi:hypothetical protein
MKIVFLGYCQILYKVSVSKISWCNYKGALLPESYSSGYNFIITVFLEIIFENNFNYGAIFKKCGSYLL